MYLPKLLMLTTILIQQCHLSISQLPIFEIAKHKIELYKIATGGIENQITRFGYLYERHEVITQDGYAITLFRLQNVGKSNNNPVLLLSGLSSTSEVYVICNESLGYVLHGQGYDVWLGNFRGNLKYSRHTSLPKSDSAFWDFSWEEMGDYDLPSMIDYILQINTNKSKLTLVTLSLSTLITMTLQATKKEYNDKISRHIAMAPVINEQYLTSIAGNVLAYFHNVIKDAYDKLLRKTVPSLLINKLFFYGGTYACLTFAKGLCQTFLQSVMGYSALLAKTDNLGLMFSLAFNGVSFRTFLSGLQLKDHDFLARYDYGREENLRKYGTESPPVYDWSRITTPTSLFYGANDALASPLSVEMISRYVKSSVKVLMEGAVFNHADFVNYIDRDQLKRVNDKVLEHIQLNNSEV